MRILLINYRYFVSGGPERYMFNIKKELEARGHEVIPFSIHSNKNVETPYSKYFVEPIGDRDAVYFEECKKTPRVILQMLSRSIYSPEVKRAIQREIDEVKPDVAYIIHFVNKLSPSVIVGAKQRGIPVVLRLSDFFLLCPRFDFLCGTEVCEDCLTKGYRSCIRKRCVKGSLAASAIRVASMKAHSWMNVYKNVDAFVTTTEFMRRKLSENGFPAEKIHCIPTFAPDPEETEGVIGDYGLYVGRLAVEKGVDTLVRAYEALPDHRLKIVGDDSTQEGQRLKAYVAGHNLKNIEFLGFQRGEALEKLYRESRFTVIPSLWYENLPNSALESYRYRKPILGCRIGSMPEAILDGKTGLLFEPGDVEGLKACILRMDDDALIDQLGQQAADYLRERFSAKRHVESLLALFESVRK